MKDKMLHIHSSQHPLADATNRLNALLHEARSQDVLLLLSGGSALALVDQIDLSTLSAHVTATVLDERWTYEARDSNFAQLTELPIWQHMQEKGIHTIDPRPHEPEDLQDTAKRFDLALKHWHVIHRDGIVIVTMGIGADGHTAGILPFPEDPETFRTLFEHTTTCVRGYTVSPEKNPHTKRMTVTLTYLRRHVHHAVLYVCGEGKKETLQRLQNKQETHACAPAMVCHAMQDVQLYTDVV